MEPWLSVICVPSSPLCDSKGIESFRSLNFDELSSKKKTSGIFQSVVSLYFCLYAEQKTKNVIQWLRDLQTAAIYKYSQVK